MKYPVLLMVIFIGLLSIHINGDYCNATLKINHMSLDSALHFHVGVTDDIGFIVTVGGRFYRSVDAGANWEDESYKLDEFEGVTGVSVDRSYHTGPGVFNYWVHGEMVFLKGAGWKLWISKDAGETFTLNYTDVPMDIIHIEGHPTRNDWLLAVSRNWGLCCGNYYCYCKLALSKSTDGGDSWEIIFGATDDFYSVFAYAEPAYSVSWGAAGTLTPENSFYVLAWDTDPYFEWTNGFVFYFENDVKRKLGSESFINGAMSFIYIKEQNAMIIGVFPNDDDFLVYVSNLDESPFTFQRQNIENPPPEIQAVKFLNYNLGSTFIGINRMTHDDYTEDFFISDIIYGDFASSLKNVVANTSIGEVDMSEISGINGVYLANIWVDGQKQSRMSFDNGVNWVPLTLNESCASCENLQIHGPTSNDYEFYIKPSFIGTILSVGNLGEFVNTNMTDLYITRDGGRVWEFFHSGSPLFEILNRGSIITLFERDSMSINYTTNLGTTWNNCEFTSNTLNETITHVKLPMNDGMAFMNVVTKSTVGNISSYSLWTIDFSDTLPNCTDDDFELFSPQDDICLFGKKSQYTRLKQGSECIVARDLSNAISDILCNCTKEDYVCNYCFTLVEDQCVMNPQCDFDILSPVPDTCVEGGFYEGRPLYRRNAGTVCENDLEEYLVNQQLPCPIAITTTELIITTYETTTIVESSEPGETTTEQIESEPFIETPANILDDLRREPVLTLTLAVLVVGLLITAITTIVIYIQTSNRQKIKA